MVKRLKKYYLDFQNSLPGTIIMAFLYAFMLIMVLLYFTGNGQFLYEV